MFVSGEIPERIHCLHKRSVSNQEQLLRLTQTRRKKKIKQFLGKNSEFVACKGNAFLVLDHEGMAKGMPLCLEHLNSSSPLASDPAY